MCVNAKISHVFIKSIVLCDFALVFSIKLYKSINISHVVAYYCILNRSGISVNPAKGKCLVFVLLYPWR